MSEKFIEIYENNITVYNKKFQIPMSNYFKTIIENVARSNEPSIIVYPGGRELNLSFIAYFSLLMRYKNYSKFDEDITHGLNENDHVYYTGRLGLYKGKKLYKLWGDAAKYFSEDIRNSSAVKIEFSHDSVEYVKETNFHKITKYNGDATRLNNIGSIKKNKTIDELITAMKLKKNLVNTLVNNSVLYIKNKNEVDEILKDTHVSFGKVKMENLTKITPISYCQNINKRMCYAGNKLKLNPVMKITCSFENALDLLYEQEDIKEIVIDLEGYLSVDYNMIEQILEFPNINKKVVLLPLEKFSDYNNFLRDKEYNVIRVSREMIEDYSIPPCSHPDIKYQSIIFRNYLDKKSTFKPIRIDSSFKFRDVNSIISRMCASDDSDELTQQVGKKVRILLSILKSYIYFDNSFGNNNKNFILQLQSEIEMDINNICLDKKYLAIMKMRTLAEMVSELTNNIISGNCFAQEIIEVLKYSSNRNILFIVQNNREKATVDTYVKNKYNRKKITCSTISKIENKSTFDVVYILGVIPRTSRLINKMFSLILSNQFHYVYHKSYLNYIKKLYNDYLRCVNDFEKTFEDSNIDYNAISSPENKRIEDDYNLISNLIDRDMSVQDTVKFYFGNSSDINDSYCDCLIDFNEYVGIFKKIYKVYRINIEKKELEYIPVIDLLVEDEILILNEEFRSGEFIEELMENLLIQDSFKEKHLEMVIKSRVWKEILLEYIRVSKLSLKEIFILLKSKGLDKTEVTFRNWIKNDFIVGPDNEDDYRIIFELCKTEAIKYHWKEIYDSCNHVRRLHIRLRSDIGKLIVESYFKGQAVSENLDYLNIDFMNKVTVCEVYSISFEKIFVPLYAVNSVKRKES